MGKEVFPAPVAPERFQTQQRFIAALRPELAGTLEAALILAASRFHRAAAQRFATGFTVAVVEPLTVIFKIADFALEVCARLGLQPGERQAQILEQAQSVAVFQLGEQRFEPGLRGGRARAMQRFGDCPQVLFGMKQVEPLPGLRETIVHQIPDPHGAIGHHEHVGRLAQVFRVTLFQGLFIVTKSALRHAVHGGPCKA